MSSTNSDYGIATTTKYSVTITNPDVDVVLPSVKYGYRTTKAGWDELVQIIRIEHDIPKLSRSREQQQEYEVFRYHMRQQFKSSLDFILITKFGFEAIQTQVPNDDSNDNSNTVWMAKHSIQEIAEPRIILVENDFPYYVEDRIVHYVLWKLKEPLTQKEIEEARAKLQSPPINALDALEWINPPSLKSIPEIDHAHFLCRL